VSVSELELRGRSVFSRQAKFFVKHRKACRSVAMGHRLSMAQASPSILWSGPAPSSFSVQAQQHMPRQGLREGRPAHFGTAFAITALCDIRRVAWRVILRQIASRETLRPASQGTGGLLSEDAHAFCANRAIQPQINRSSRCTPPRAALARPRGISGTPRRKAAASPLLGHGTSAQRRWRPAKTLDPRSNSTSPASHPAAPLRRLRRGHSACAPASKVGKNGASSCVTACYQRFGDLRKLSACVLSGLEDDNSARRRQRRHECPDAAVSRSSGHPQLFCLRRDTPLPKYMFLVPAVEQIWVLMILNLSMIGVLSWLKHVDPLRASSSATSAACEHNRPS